MGTSKDPFTLCLVTDTLCDANGVSRFIQDIAKEARVRDKNFFVLTATKKRYCQKAHNLVILKPLLSMKMPFYPALDLVLVPPFLRLYRQIKKINPDMLHISTPGVVGISALIIARILGIPIMGTYHTDFPAFIYSNTNSQYAKKITDSMMRLFYRCFSGLFLRSHMYHDSVKEILKIEDKKLFTIPAGIDVSRFDASLREKSIWANYNVPIEGKKVLYVGRVTKEKNIAFLLDIWKKVHQINHDAWLILVGSGEYYHDREKYASYHVKFLGHREGIELKTIYASADILAFPSVTDTLGQVVLEGMASGLPVLVTDVGGPQTLVNKGTENGLILPSTCKDAWENAIVGLLNDEERLALLSENALETAKELTISKSFDYFWEVSKQQI